MVSSKCNQVESPSPLVFTAPLIPPCAQTECERFTGTTEIRSTSCPASAIFIAAASPARPPPTMAIFDDAAIKKLKLRSRRCGQPRFLAHGFGKQSAWLYECERGVDPHNPEDDEKSETRVHCYL